jgi:hypothetical protein
MMLPFSTDHAMHASVCGKAESGVPFNHHKHHSACVCKTCTSILAVLCLTWNSCVVMFAVNRAIGA